MFIQAAKTSEIASGGIKAVELEGKEIIICNYNGVFYALDRRCGHMNAPLDMGTLEGYILTCPMHDAQFDITTGKALSGPVPEDLGNAPLPDRVIKFFQYIGSLMAKIKTCNINTYPIRIDGDIINIEL